MRRILICGIVATALTLSGCSALGAGSSGGQTASELSAPDSPAKAGGEVDKATAATGSRQLVTTGTVTVTVETPVRAAAAATSIVEEAGGRVDDRAQSAATGDRGGSAKLTVRIPSPKLTPTLDRIAELGRVEQVAITSTDVTGHAVDLDARITALRASVERLTALVAKAPSTTDLVALESALSERQANLESLEAEKRGLDDRVDLATITLRFGTEAVAPVALPDTFGDGLVTGWEALASVGAVLLVVAGLLLPWILVGAIIAAGVVLIVRATRRRGKASPPAVEAPADQASST